MKRMRVVVVAGLLTLGLVGPLSTRLVAQGEQERFEAHPSTQAPSVRVTLETLERWESELSNWGRWGPDDQRGTLKRPERRLYSWRMASRCRSGTL